ncbi:MAG: hypothetical protein AAGI01_05725 [Myxococcota bacterium]
MIALALTPGCVPIGCTIPGLIWPELPIQVVDEEGAGVAQASVLVARVQVEPFLQTAPKNTRWAAPEGLGAFVSHHEIGPDTIYPLMLGGVGIHEWYVCAQAPGRATKVVYVNTENEAAGEIEWGEVHGGVALPEVEVELEPGESEPCEQALDKIKRPGSSSR